MTRKSYELYDLVYYYIIKFIRKIVLHRDK